MELIDKTRNILKKLDLIDPIIDLKYDNQKNIIGFITSESFKKSNDEDAQDKIWGLLTKYLAPDELNRILAVFHETPYERSLRFTGGNDVKSIHSQIWFHICKDNSKYWIFIDVVKINEDYHSFFIVINSTNNFNRGLRFTYPKKVIEFMQLKQGEIINELLTNAFNNAVAEIKMDLMLKHSELEKKGVNWKDNMYSYVYDRIEITPATNKDLFFSDKEIKDITKAFKNMQQYGVYNSIQQAIEQSKIINISKQLIF